MFSIGVGYLFPLDLTYGALGSGFEILHLLPKVISNPYTFQHTKPKKLNFTNYNDDAVYHKGSTLTSGMILQHTHITSLLKIKSHRITSQAREKKPNKPKKKNQKSNKQTKLAMRVEANRKCSHPIPSHSTPLHFFPSTHLTSLLTSFTLLLTSLNSLQNQGSQGKQGRSGVLLSE